jgi:hypothetical protein
MAPLATESLFWIGAAACAIAQAAILRAVVGGSDARPGHRQLGANGPDRPWPGRGAHRLSEAAWALLPGVALAFVLVWTWHTVHQVDHTSPPTKTQPLLSPTTGA